METEFKVQVGEFEGPLELLLDLIEKRKLHISEVSLAKVADEFIEYTRGQADFPIADSADFILIASTLLLIKSKSLLPNLPLTEEEAGSIVDLEERLALYKRYKELASGLGKMFGNFLYFSRERKSLNVVFSPTPEITLATLKDSLNEVLLNIPKAVENLPKVVVEKIVSLEEMISKLSERISQSLRTSFGEFAGNSGSTSSPQAKINVIVSFLAMLELVKQGMLRVSQENHFDDIQMESDKLNIPIYK